MVKDNFDCFVSVVKKYSVIYDKFERMQKDRNNYSFIPQHGDQKTGIIGESFIYELKNREKKKNLKYGSANEKCWDLSYTKGKKEYKIQVKTVSAFSKTRRISPIHYGWDELFLVSLNKKFIPNGIWIVERQYIIDWPKDDSNKYKILKSLKMPAEGVDIFECKYFQSSTNIIEDFICKFRDIYKSS